MNKKKIDKRIVKTTETLSDQLVENVDRIRRLEIHIDRIYEQLNEYQNEINYWKSRAQHKRHTTEQKKAALEKAKKIASELERDTRKAV